MKKTFTLYPETLDYPNAIPSPEVFLCENKLQMRNGFQDGPSEMVMRNLLSYAKALSVNNTKDAGIINVVLN
jgi:hypothetical protein